MDKTKKKGILADPYSDLEDCTSDENGTYLGLEIPQLVNFHEVKRKDKLVFLQDAKDWFYIIVEESRFSQNPDKTWKLEGYDPICFGRQLCGEFHIAAHDNCFDAKNWRAAIDLLDEIGKERGFDD